MSGDKVKEDVGGGQVGKIWVEIRYSKVLVEIRYSKIWVDIR